MNKKTMRLNKYLSNCGIANRRDADTLIKKGLVSVNGKVVRKMGFQVAKGDEVIYNGDKLKWPVQREYILMNKPKNCLSNSIDSGHKSIIQILENLEIDELETIDELGLNELGLILVTNDAYLREKLRNPELALKQIYLLELDKELNQEDFEKIEAGIDVDGKILEVKSLAYPDETNEKLIGIEIWDNRKQILKKMFDKLGYEITRLDRTVYGNFTKKDLPRDKWRFAEEKEIIKLRKFI
jgi:23S rRNA pseudouridine2605 synthase